MAAGEVSRRAVLRTAGLAPALPVLSGCSLLMPPRYNFRLTIEALTSAGQRTASAVYEVTGKHFFDYAIRQSLDIYGEAAWFDHPLGPVFVPLKGNDHRGEESFGGLAHKVLAAASHYSSYWPEKERRKGDLFDEINSLDRWFGATEATMTRRPNDNYYAYPVVGDRIYSTDLPSMLRFGDIRDPHSVEWIRPEELGVQRITFKTTRHGVTTGIDKRLPWLGLPWHGGGSERWWKTAATSPDGRVQIERSAFHYFG